MAPDLDPGETSELDLDAEIARALREQLPSVAEQTVAAVIIEVPGYADSLSGDRGMNISNAVEKALLGFLTLAARPRPAAPGTPLGPALETAYALGRGEARSGRSVDALLAAYRVGARVAWREMAATAAGAGMPVTTMASFADLVFGYIDELSAASVAGHTDELASSGRIRERYRERLGQHLLSGAPADVLVASAARAEWPAPITLTAVLLSTRHDRGLTALLPAETLRPREDLPGLPAETSVLLIPDLDQVARRRLLDLLTGRPAVIGPARPWMQVHASYRRSLRALDLRPAPGDASAVVDTEHHLTELVLRADPDALADLRTQALAPLAHLRPAVAERLTATLRSWLLHQGRRDEVAAELTVHAQTVRYRMGQLRELYGERLQDPATVLALTVALGPEPSS